VIAVALSVIAVIANFATLAIPADEDIPTEVIVIAVVLGVIGIIAAVGLWILRRWGRILTIVVAVLNLLSALPGIAFAPEIAFKIISAAFVIISAYILYLMWRPEVRQAIT